MLEHILTLLLEWTFTGFVCTLVWGVYSRRLAREDQERENDEQA